jgi:catechol 2,3-dioxygenase-like lactoylglutathione lyase family enzyme
MSNQGIVSARHVDHVGMTVPDLNEAIRFFEDAIGAKLLWRVGPFAETPTGFPIEGVTLAMIPPLSNQCNMLRRCGKAGIGKKWVRFRSSISP